jgi:hypothetical protein
MKVVKVERKNEVLKEISSNQGALRRTMWGTKKHTEKDVGGCLKVSFLETQRGVNNSVENHKAAK